MYHYVKTRKKGILDWRILREDGKILVFKDYETAKGYVKDSEGTVSKIMPLNCHPMHKISPIHGKKYRKVGW